MITPFGEEVIVISILSEDVFTWQTSGVIPSIFEGSVLMCLFLLPETAQLVPTLDFVVPEHSECLISPPSMAIKTAQIDIYQLNRIFHDIASYYYWFLLRKTQNTSHGL